MDYTTLDHIAHIFKAVADPKRQKLLFYLRHHGESTVNKLTEILDITQSATSQHLKALLTIGAVTRRKSGQHVYYRVRSDKLCDAFTDFIRVYETEIKNN